jgi:hypothetical protein
VPAWAIIRENFDGDHFRAFMALALRPHRRSNTATCKVLQEPELVPASLIGTTRGKTASPQVRLPYTLRMLTEQIDLAECVACAECGAWMVLRLAIYNPELELYEFTCPRCGIETGTAKRKIWRLPCSVVQSGHFTLDEYDQFGHKYKMASSR